MIMLRFVLVLLLFIGISIAAMHGIPNLFLQSVIVVFSGIFMLGWVIFHVDET